MTRIFFLVIVLFASLPMKRAQKGRQTDPSLCPKGWIHLVSSCYYFNTTRTTMSTARSSCQNQGGDLVLPLNTEEHNAIWKVAKEKKLTSPWIGLIEQQKANFYSLDGKIPSYINWGSAQPNPDGNENCVAFWQKLNGEWHDIPCNYNLSYICQQTMRSRYATCTSGSCLNGGVCLNGNCSCKSGYTGSVCDVDIDECTEFPGICQNNATCKNIIGSYTCNCTTAYTERNCSINIDDCKTDDGSSKCLNNGTCIDGEGTFFCKCQDPYIGDFCELVDECKEKNNLCGKGYCPSEKFGTREAYGIFEWPETPVGDNSTQACAYNNESFASRECWYTNQTDSGGFWGPIVVEQCRYRDTRSKDLFLLAQKEVSISNVVKTTQEVKKLSSDNSSHPLQAGNIGNIATVLEKIVAVKQKANEIFEDFYTTVDNVLDARVENVFQSQQDTNSSSRIVEALNNFVETFVIGPSEKFQNVKRNYAVNIQAVQPQNFSGLTFSEIVRKSRELPLRIIDISTEFNDSVPQASSSSISIPRTIFDESIIMNSSRQQRIIFVFYKKTSFFKVSSKKTSSRLNSFVIAGSIKGLSVTNLSEPVEIALQSIAPRGDANSNLCSYWDLSLGKWSQEGCRFQSVLSDGRILCNCNHLTNFAMLLDINPAVTTKHDRILGVISYVGCSLSLVGLTLTIITILILRELRSKIPSQILLNFCIALSLTLIVFLAASERSSARCRTVAVALHYFLLAAFFWMAVEAFNMYRAFVKIFPTSSSPFKFMLKCCLFAWGTPAIIVAITMIVALDKYGDNGNCRLHGVPFIVAFLTPVTLILAGNIVAFCLIIRSLLTSGNRVTSDRKVSGFQQARQGIAIMVLLGLTWLFGFLAIDDAKLAFQWFFCIFNSLQGFFVFILFCILPAGTRQLLRKRFWKKSSSPTSGIATATATGNTYSGKTYSCLVNDQCSASGDELKKLDGESNCSDNK